MGISYSVLNPIFLLPCITALEIPRMACHIAITMRSGRFQKESDRFHDTNYNFQLELSLYGFSLIEQWSYSERHGGSQDISAFLNLTVSL